MFFAPLRSENGYRSCPFWECMNVFVVSKRVIYEFEMYFKESFCWRSDLRNNDKACLSKRIWRVCDRPMPNKVYRPGLKTGIYFGSHVREQCENNIFGLNKVRILRTRWHTSTKKSRSIPGFTVYNLFLLFLGCDEGAKKSYFDGTDYQFHFWSVLVNRLS